MPLPPIYNSPRLKKRRSNLRTQETEAEAALWAHLRAKRLNGFKFFRQYSVGHYILDFYCPRCRLAVELDGGHHANPDQKEYDQVRTDFLAALDIQTLRFWNADIRSRLPSVLQQIAQALTPPTSPYAKER